MNEMCKLPSNFIKHIIEKDLKENKHRQIITRFPPEPNGHLHIGHVKAISINYIIAKEYNGKFNLRFDDTNPLNEDIAYVNSIIEDLKWLGMEPDNIYYASDYFDTFYEKAELLIKKGLAYIDEISADQMRKQRGTLTEKGVNSPYRDRPIEESLSIFREMKDGKHPEGSYTLRTKIDMGSPNMNMRDPVIYRIMFKSHYRTGDKWCIYPMYDFSHPLEDAIEGITHSLCSLEFQDHRPLYDWYVKNTEMDCIPRQIEFAKMGINNKVMGKRVLKRLVQEGYVSGWDDPRLVTIKGLARRGYTPKSLVEFVTSAGVSKENSVHDFNNVEHYYKNDVQNNTSVYMGVINPLKITINNLDEDKIIKANNNDKNEELGSRDLIFSKNLYIDKNDFMENPIKGYKRLSPGVEVRLKYAYFIKCEEVIKDDNGNVIELICSYDEKTKSGSGFKDRKPNGTIHWISEKDATDITLNQYEELTKDIDTSDEVDPLIAKLNPDSQVTKTIKIEKRIKDLNPMDRFQLLREGYYIVDKYSDKDNMIINETCRQKTSFEK